ncbi:hypothetical protein Barb6XT_03130 [Bacteroidales bacterium Barb6XT]|nr:hypothetical protein Barb6XT_03130 [Bacteroidales bacterium Barb6XT]
MNKVIGLWGVASTGKTTTLNLLIDLLEVATTDCPMPTPQPERVERRKAFIYNGFKIGIATGGDTDDIVKENCAFFDDEKCDIVFSATRKRYDSGSHIELTNYAERFGLSVTWIEKDTDTTSRTKYIVNLQQALDLLDMI